MDVNIGEVQADVEPGQTPSSGGQGESQDEGIMERAHREQLSRRRYERHQHRLCAR